MCEKPSLLLKNTCKLTDDMMSGMINVIKPQPWYSVSYSEQNSHTTLSSVAHEVYAGLSGIDHLSLYLQECINFAVWQQHKLRNI